MFKVFSCGTLSSHMAIWLACSESAFWAGLQEHARATEARSRADGQRRRGLKWNWGLGAILTFYPSWRTTAGECVSKINWKLPQNALSRKRRVKGPVAIQCQSQKPHSQEWL